MGTERALGTGLLGAAAWYLAAAGAMVALMATTSPAERLSEQLTDDPDLVSYRLPFVAASLLAPALIGLLVLLVWARGEGIGIRDGLAMMLLPAYLVCSSVAYVSQLTMLPGLVELDPSSARAWYFLDERSIPFALDMLGYAFMGLAACLLAGAFLERRGLLKLIGWSLLAVGLTSVAALVSHALASDVFTSVLTWTSAALTLPLVVGSVVLGVRLRRHRPPVLDVEPADLWA